MSYNFLKISKIYFPFPQKLHPHSCFLKLCCFYIITDKPSLLSQESNFKVILNDYLSLPTFVNAYIYTSKPLKTIICFSAAFLSFLQHFYPYCTTKTPDPFALPSQSLVSPDCLKFSKLSSSPTTIIVLQRCTFASQIQNLNPHFQLFPEPCSCLSFSFPTSVLFLNPADYWLLVSFTLAFHSPIIICIMPH